MEIKPVTAPRSFAVFLQQLADGDLNAELSEQFHKLGVALQAESLTRQDAVTGGLTFKLKAKCDPRGIVHFVWDVKMEPPKPKRCGASVWVNKQGQFVHDNPRQAALFPREVKIEDAEIREVDAPQVAVGKEI